MKLYDYHRSTAAWRVRIGLALKGLDVERIPVDLREGDQAAPGYLARNPQGLVPTLQSPDGLLGQSLAILEYLDETHPTPPLLPRRAFDRAQMRAQAQLIACDVHPLNNLRVLNYLRGPLAQEEAEVQRWIAHWIRLGFEALEQQAPERGFLGGERPMLPDLLLVPQVYNARRFGVPLDAFPRIVAIDARCMTLQPFIDAAPGVPAAA